MNTLAALAALTIALATGCGTTSDGGQAFNCDTARDAYELYQASLDVREPSDDEIKYARLAGAFLAARCGWVAPKTVKSLKRDADGNFVAAIESKEPPKDSYGVPILYPPHE